MLAVHIVLFRGRTLGLGKLNLEGFYVVRRDLDILGSTFAGLKLLGLLLDLNGLGLEQLLLVVLALA